MSSITQARDWASALVHRECRGSGDIEHAMHRLEGKYGIPWRTFWDLRYRPPSDVFAGVYLKLKAAFEAECQRQERQIYHERRIAEAKLLSLQAVAQSLDDRHGPDRVSAVEMPAVARGEDQPRSAD